MSEEDIQQIQHVETKPILPEYYEQLIRVSSNQSSPSIEEQKIIDSLENESDSVKLSKEQQNARELIGQSVNQNFSKSQSSTLFSNALKHDEQMQKEAIKKQAQKQKIGATYDYFALSLSKYRHHLLSRKIVLTNLTSMVDKYKNTKALPVILLKEYFKNYSASCSNFHQKIEQYQVTPRLERKNKVQNMHAELKPGFELLINLRKMAGNEMNRLDKYIKAVIEKIDKIVESYWKKVATYQNKSTSKRSVFEEKEKNFQKKIEKIVKIYGKGRVGEEVSQDFLQQMIKFIKEERELRISIFEWGKQIIQLRKNTIEADFQFFQELQSVLNEYKNFNNSVYQLERKEFVYLQKLNQDIQKNYLYEVLCSPLDSDYILSVFKFIKKSPVTVLTENHYEDYMNEQYFGDIIGQASQFFKGIIIKDFLLKNQDQQLIVTISNNLILYSKKTFQIKFKMKMINVSGEFQGNGCVTLKEKVKGIIFNSEHFENITLKDDISAQELIQLLKGQTK